MRLRTGVLAVLALTTHAAPVHAAPRPAPKPKLCKQITDATGDVYAHDAARTPAVPDDGLDITSGDIEVTGNVIKAAIRVRDYNSPPTTSPTGGVYEVQFRVAGSNDLFYMNASIMRITGTTFDAGYRADPPAPVPGVTVPTSLGTPDGVVDNLRNEVRLSAPLSLFGSRAKFPKGGKITAVEVFTGRGARGRAVFADDAKLAKPYAIGTPTCIINGR